MLDIGPIRLLFDTPPELRVQLLREGVDRVDAVLYTHLHADHVHGIDDLRSFSQLQRASLPLYGPAQTVAHLRRAFEYIFDDLVVPVPGTSKPRLTLEVLNAGTTVTIAGVDVLPLAFEHGEADVLGYRIGPVAYVTDAKRVPDLARSRLRGIELLVLSSLWWRSHPTHMSIEEAIETAQAIGAPRTLLTHLTHETSHQDLLAQLPAGIEPAYDGLTVEIGE